MLVGGLVGFLPCWLLHALKKKSVIILYHVELKLRHIDEIGGLLDINGQIEDRSLKVPNWSHSEKQR